jgi:hypothetical protein
MAELLILPILNSIVAGILTGILNRFIIRGDCHRPENNINEEHEDIDDLAEFVSVSSCSSGITDIMTISSD